MTTLPAGKYRLARVPLSYINLRAQPSATSADLGDLYPGMFVDLTGVASGDWVECVSPENKRGWVSLQGGTVVFEAVDIKPLPSLTGIDVSGAGQTSVNWQQVKAQGYGFGIVRATQGIVTSKPVGLDTKFRAFMDGALKAEMRTGVYHSFIASVDGKAQADYFHAAIYPYLDRLAFPPAIDVELHNDQTPAAITERLYAMAMTLEALLGQKPMLYTSPGFWNTYVTAKYDAYFAQCALWCAHWTDAPAPLLPRSWERSGAWKLWQYSSSGKVAGVGSQRVDLNRAAS